MLSIAQITIPGNIFDYLDYLAPEAPLPIGSRVWVKLRGKRILGVVVGIASVEAVTYKLSPIEEVIDDAPVLSERLLKLARWLAEYY